MKVETLKAHNLKLKELLKKARNHRERSLIKSKIQLNDEIIERESK